LFLLQLTWADLATGMRLGGLKDKYGADVLKDFPHLKDLLDRTSNLPNIKHWLETRPKTAM
jgi:hypothetical protein